MTRERDFSAEAQIEQHHNRYTSGYVAGSKAPVGHTHNYGCFDTIWGAGFKAAQRAKAAFLQPN